MVEFALLSQKTLRPLAALSVRENQAGFVATNLMTMAQSIFEPGSEIYGIWDGGDAVGLLAIIDMAHPDAELDDEDDPDGVYIWRLMVDKSRQGRGYGMAALDFAKSVALKKGRSNLVISVVDEPGSALPLYQSFGFAPTGRLVDGEVELIMRLA
ncbi:GNAT family N-acetyltransferase [Ruegeria atlantica]|uniref:Acetyltransferase (GNAT) family protein n=1 Tax=Ruegeria atlantica TaxID=81569 RepID=A0A0P1ENE6_9RHOB|nr:GNAT family N-acetyltransferase [Ruegeria atlantica]CUH43302.1 Acetyltransferase (GNAT) family protein [Ruegeria atlantica]